MCYPYIPITKKKITVLTEDQAWVPRDRGSWAVWRRRALHGLSRPQDSSTGRTVRSPHPSAAAGAHWTDQETWQEIWPAALHEGEGGRAHLADTVPPQVFAPERPEPSTHPPACRVHFKIRAPATDHWGARFYRRDLRRTDSRASRPDLVKHD